MPSRSDPRRLLRAGLHARTSKTPTPDHAPSPTNTAISLTNSRWNRVRTTKNVTATGALEEARTPQDDQELPEVSARVWTKIGEGGRVVIPAEIRRLIGVKEGDRILLLVEDGELHVITVSQGIKRAQELARPYIRPGVSIVDELIAERRAEVAREGEELREWQAARAAEAARE
jgi:AbrB family looped-hinge helix DNA binding protein